MRNLPFGLGQQSDGFPSVVAEDRQPDREVTTSPRVSAMQGRATGLSCPA